MVQWGKRKMRTVTRLAAMILTLAVFGCQSEQERLQSAWIGQHYSNLLGSLGAPEQTIDDGIGGKLLIYQEPKHFITSTRAKRTESGEIIITPSEDIGHIQESIFRTDPNGIILAVKVNFKDFRQ